MLERPRQKHQDFRRSSSDEPTEKIEVDVGGREKTAAGKSKERFVEWSKKLVAGDEKWVNETFTFLEDGSVIVKGDLNLTGASIDSLPKGLKEVKGSLYLFDCTNLESLENIPQKIGKDLLLANCSKLTSLKHIPKQISGSLAFLNCKGLTDLEFISKIIGGDLNIEGCVNLTTLEHLSGVKVEVDLWMREVDLNLPQDLEVKGRTIRKGKVVRG